MVQKGLGDISILLFLYFIFDLNTFGIKTPIGRTMLKVIYLMFCLKNGFFFLVLLKKLG